MPKPDRSSRYTPPADTETGVPVPSKRFLAGTDGKARPVGDGRETERDLRERRTRTTRKVAGWTAIFVAGLLFGIPGVVGFLFGGATFFFGVWVLWLARQRKESHRVPGRLRTSLENSLLIGPQARRIFRWWDSHRDVNRSRHRIPLFLLVPSVVFMWSAVTYSVTSGYRSRFGLYSADVGGTNLDRTVMFSAVTFVVVFGARRLARHKQWDPPAQKVRYILRIVTVAVMVGVPFLGVQIGMNAADSVRTTAQTSPPDIELARFWGDISEPEWVTITPLSPQEIREIVGGSAQGADAHFADLSVLTGNPSLIIDTNPDLDTLTVYISGEDHTAEVPRLLVTVEPLR